MSLVPTSSLQIFRQYAGDKAFVVTKDSKVTLYVHGKGVFQFTTTRTDTRLEVKELFADTLLFERVDAAGKKELSLYDVSTIRVKTGSSEIQERRISGEYLGRSYEGDKGFFLKDENEAIQLFDSKSKEVRPFDQARSPLVFFRSNEEFCVWGRSAGKMSSISIFSPKLGQSLGFTVDGKLDTHLEYKLGSGEFSYLAFLDADLLPKMAVFNIHEHSDIEMFMVTLPEWVLPSSVEQISYDGVHIQQNGEAWVWSLDKLEQKCVHRALCSFCDFDRGILYTLEEPTEGTLELRLRLLEEGEEKASKRSKKGLRIKGGNYSSMERVGGQIYLFGSSARAPLVIDPDTLEYHYFKGKSISQVAKDMRKHLPFYRMPLVFQ